MIIPAKNYTQENSLKLKEKVYSLEKELENMKWGVNKTNEEVRILYKELERWNKELERRVEERTKELKESQAQLIQSGKISALGELAAGVAHELNQPLNVTKIICQSILRDIEKDRFDKEDVKGDLPEIVSQMNKMAEIIEHMRIFSRRTVGMLRETVELNIIIENALKFTGQQLQDYNISLIKELSSPLPVIIGDPVRLEQVFLNLITNARDSVESCRKEDGRIEIRSYKVDGGKEVAIEVKDNGKGISEDVKEKIFQPFFTTKEVGKGTGLGLSVASKIIEEHKGRIEVESKIGEGALFRVILPAEQTRDRG